MEDKPQQGEQAPAAFNAAVAALMRLDRILVKMQDLSLIAGEEDYPLGYCQHQRRRLLKDFYIQSIPLIKDETAKTTIKEKFYSIIPGWNEVLRGGEKVRVPAYSAEVERQMDDVLIMLQEELQKQGMLMPERKEKIL